MLMPAKLSMLANNKIISFQCVSSSGGWVMSSCLSSGCSFIIVCVSSVVMMPVKYMREIMENFQAFCNQTSLHGWQYITQRPETDGFWAGEVQGVPKNTLNI